MNQFTKELLVEIEEYACSKGFTKKGKFSFSKKDKLRKEDLWSIQIRKGRSPYQCQDYVSSAVGIYFPEVRKFEKKIIKDFLNSYPLIGGATGLFTNSQNYVEYEVFDYHSGRLALEKLINEFEDGGISLFDTFSDLQSIMDGINTKHIWLSEYFINTGLREKITIACVLFVCNGKDTSVKCLENNISNENKKEDILEKFLKL